MTKEYIEITEVAKIVRKELKTAFPATKFSVRCEKYSMGQHLEVTWTDGPNKRSVEAITDKYHGTGFDGMTDSTTYHDEMYQGRMVHFCGSRPSCNRRVSDAFVAKCEQAWAALSAGEQCKLANRGDFPAWQHCTMGYKLANWLST